MIFPACLFVSVFQPLLFSGGGYTKQDDVMADVRMLSIVPVWNCTSIAWGR